MIRCCGYSLVVFALAACGADQPASWVDQQYDQDLSRFDGNQDVLVERGLLADRKHRYVDLLATASGIEAGSPIDLLIAGRDSTSPEYLARSVASAGEIQAALEFIGLTAGHPIDIERLLYWPKGERVTTTFYWDEAGTGRFDAAASIEQFLLDGSLRTTLPEFGFRFVGPGQDAGQAIEVLTAYNSGTTLLEVPYTVDQRTAASRLTVGSSYTLAPGQALRIRLRPEFRGDQRRVQEFAVDVVAGEGDGRLSSLAVTLNDPNGRPIVQGGFEDVFVYLEEHIADGREPFVTFRFEHDLAARSVRDVARFIAQFLVEQQVRVEPIAEDPYFSAFLPNEAWRDPDRRNRDTQPLEVYLQGSVVQGEVLQRTGPGEANPLHFANAAELSDALANGGPWTTDGAFLFASPDMPYGVIKATYELLREEFPNFYVFL
jgi:hypothetical protein